MPKLLCTCGTALNLSVIPSPHGSIVIPETAFDDLRECLLDEHIQEPHEWRSLVGDLLGARNPSIKQAYVCPTCGRLYLFDPPSSEKPAAVWTLESGDAARFVKREPEDP